VRAPTFTQSEVWLDVGVVDSVALVVLKQGRLCESSSTQRRSACRFVIQERMRSAFSR